jgi:drug/metabolite transporter (DMT)-like permease
MFALAAALCYGGADYLGGSATRRTSVVSVLLVSSTAGSLIILVAALLAGTSPQLAGVAWGAAGGVVGSVGLMFFYVGLATGPMNVVAPLSALVSTVLPVGVALASGERPGPAVYAGALICLAAIALISSGGRAMTDRQARGQGEEGGRPGGGGRAGGICGEEAGRSGGGSRARGICYGVVAGTTFGLFFLFIRNGGESGALWPVAGARVMGLVVVIIAAAGIRARPVPWQADRRLFGAALFSGVLDAGANLCYVLATRAGLFGIAVVMTSLYPAVTILLARVLLGERMQIVQRAGMLLAGVGIILVTA